MSSLTAIGLLFFVGLLKLVSSAAVSKGGIVGEGQGKLVFSHVVRIRQKNQSIKITQFNLFYFLFL